MLVATFGPTTGWAGRTITFYDGRFTLEGHGPITAGDVLEYDRQGHLLWAYDGLREWATSLTPPPAHAPAPTLAPVTQTATPMQAVPAAGQVAAALPAAAAPEPMSSQLQEAEPAPMLSQAAAAEPAAPTPALAEPAPMLSQAVEAPAAAAAQASGMLGSGTPAPVTPQPAATAAPAVAQDLWRAQCLDFDARVLAALGGAEAPDTGVLASAARCVCWDFPAAATEERRRAFTLYDRDGREVYTVWAGADAALPEPGAPAAAPAPAGWILLDAPWASLTAPAGWMGGAPESAGQAALAAMQARGPDWQAWAGEWFSPMSTAYATSRGQLAALLFGVDVGAASLDDAAYVVFMRQELDAGHRDVTLQWRTDDLARRMAASGLVESVAYGPLGGWQASRIVAASQAGFAHGPRGLHIVEYVFVDSPYTYSLAFTLPSASPSRLGEADRCAATFVFKG
jgi:hypothetical protein